MFEIQDVPRRRFHQLAAAAFLGAMTPSLARSNSMVGGWITIKVPPPPDVASKLKNLTARVDARQPLMETSKEPPIRKYREFLDQLAAKKLSQIDQLKAVNTYVNANVARKKDGKDDVWSEAYTTLKEGGDCEDIALVKRWGLKRLKFARENLFLVMGMTLLTRPPEGHALLAVRLADNVFQVMYNLVYAIEDATSLRYFEPAYAVNEFGFWRVDRVDRVGGDYWQEAYLRAVKRQGGKA